MNLIIQPYYTPYGTEYHYEWYDENGNYIYTSQELIEVEHISNQKSL